MFIANPIARTVENRAGRITGPLTLRLILQPILALFFGLRDGFRDGREGRPAYLWAFLFKPWKRRDLIHSAWKSIGTVFVMAISIDAAYQFIELHWFYPGEALITAVILACVPYVLICGPVSRIMSGRTRGETISGAQHEPIQQERIAR